MAKLAWELFHTHCWNVLNHSCDHDEYVILIISYLHHVFKLIYGGRRVTTWQPWPECYIPIHLCWSFPWPFTYPICNLDIIHSYYLRTCCQTNHVSIHFSLSCLFNWCLEDILTCSSSSSFFFFYKIQKGGSVGKKNSLKLKSIELLHDKFFNIQENGFVDIIGGISTSCKCIGNIKWGPLLGT